VARTDICKSCGSTAVLFLSTGDKGRHCDNCGAGWYVIPRESPGDEENARIIKAKMSKTLEESRAWLKEQQEKSDA